MSETYFYKIEKQHNQFQMVSDDFGSCQQQILVEDRMALGVFGVFCVVETEADIFQSLKYSCRTTF